MIRQVPAVLAERTVVEFVRPDAASVTRIAVSFAGQLAAGLGGRVVRLVPDGAEPLRDWGPRLPDGSSALQRFLEDGKQTQRALPAGAADLVTDDPALAGAWSAGASVLVEGAHDDPQRRHSELTVLASSGLLDIFGDADREPLPLPGHQVAYAAGTAALNALICARFRRVDGAPPQRARVSVLDVALWLNWKYFLSAHLRQPGAGVGRAEDWTTYRCRDGHVAVVFQDKDLAKLAELTGEASLAEPRFATRDARRANIAAFQEILARWAAGQERDAVAESARRLGIPIGPVLDAAELLDDRQMLARAFLDLAEHAASYGRPRLPVVLRRAA